MPRPHTPGPWACILLLTREGQEQYLGSLSPTGEFPTPLQGCEIKGLLPAPLLPSEELDSRETQFKTSGVAMWSPQPCDGLGLCPLINYLPGRTVRDESTGAALEGSDLWPRRV